MVLWIFHHTSSLRLWFARQDIRAKFLTWAFFVGATVAGLAGGILGAGKKNGNLTTVISTGSGNQSGILLIGHIYDVDIDNRRVQISWLIDGCGQYRMPYTTSYSVENCGRLNRPTFFFINGAPNPSGIYDPNTTPWGVEYVDNDLDAGPVYVQAINEFQTSHPLELVDWHSTDQLFTYPFDTYYLHTTLTAIDSTTNNSSPLLSISPVDSTNNFDPFILQTNVIHSKPPVQGLNNTVESRYVRIALHRTILTQFFVMSLFITNWALTGVVLYITICANDGMPMQPSILVLPLTVTLTIPTLRALWIGAPAFGLLLDVCGIFVQMSAIVLCSIFLLVRIALRSPHKRELKKRRYMRLQLSGSVDADEIPLTLMQTTHEVEDSEHTLVNQDT
ncbi:hypothetical protein BDW22DRAFT_1429857 [Trametopsis cervina]|nr:hypothetical protein BDW22DRAFT_1429857 [Trametopsis cervina]